MKEIEQRVFDAKFAAGGVGAALGFNLEIIKEWLGLGATVCGLMVSVATFIYVCLGIKEKITTANARKRK